MTYRWIRKDFSGGSSIKELLLRQMLAHGDSRIIEIDEMYEDIIAAAGISVVEQAQIQKEIEKKKNKKL